MEDIMSFEDFKKSLNEKKEGQSYSYGCIMGFFGSPIKKISINKEDLYDNDENEYGLELDNEAHVTLLYGLDDDKIEEQDIIDLFSMIDCPEVTTNEISLFENKDYDVVKFDIESKHLTILNKMLTSMFPYKSDYPDYHIMDRSDIRMIQNSS
jgi:hypothetical protein